MPLKQRVFHVLLALEERPLHGYAIRKRVLDLSDGAFELEPGGLYRLLARLHRDCLIEQTDAPPAEESEDERRQYYVLTEQGRRELVTEARRLAGLVGRPEIADLVGRT